MPDDNEKPTVVEAVDKLNDLIEDAALTAADAAIDPAQVASTTNEQVFIPERTEAVPKVKGGGGGGDGGKK